jgi:hypothetical protein
VTSCPVTPAEEVPSLRWAFSPVCSAPSAKVPNLAISYCTYGSLRSVIVAVSTRITSLVCVGIASAQYDSITVVK